MTSAGWMLSAAGLASLAALLAARVAPRLWLGLTLCAALAALAASAVTLGGAGDWNWQPAIRLGGEPVHLRLDGLSAWFLALLGMVGGAGACYSSEYWSERTHPRSGRRGRVWWTLILISIGLVLLISNGLHFLIAWELFTVASYFLIALDRGRREARAAAWLYLAASHFSVLCLFAFFAALAVHTGGWDLGPLARGAGVAPLFWLALAGFGLKAGMFPLHLWLPSAHASAPSHVSALMSGVSLKVGVYGLIRFSGWLPAPLGADWAVVGLGLASAVLGVAFALGQHDLKRLLAYHSVENIGIILTGLGFALVAAKHGLASWALLALAGALLHVWNHGLFKSLLFFGAGAVLHGTGTREMSRLGGLWRTMPWTTALFALGAAAICGLPPLNGFVSEWLISLGLLAALGTWGGIAAAAAGALVLLALAGALALACFSKVCGVVFLGAPRTPQAAAAEECGPAMRVPMLVIAAACAGIGLAPALLWPALARACAAWNPAWSGRPAPAALGELGACACALAAAAILAAGCLRARTTSVGPRRTVTWDCGYASPGPRLQYTAGSFAGTLTSWFAWALRPERRERRPEEVFPRCAGMEERTPETVLEHLVEPAGGWVLRAAGAARRMQHGRAQAYLAYLLLGLAALALVALGGSAK